MDFRFYSIDEEFVPIIDNTIVNRLDALVVYVNYFGLCAKQVDYVIEQFGSQRVVVDSSQSYKFEPEKALATIYSPRKFFPLPDGGMLFTDVPIDMPSDFSPVQLGHFEKRLRGENEDALTSFRDSEAALAASGPLSCSHFSLRLLQSFLDDKSFLCAREKYFDALDEKFGSLNRLNKAFSKSHATFPLCYPILTSDKIDLEQLISQGIYTPIYWPTLADRDISRFESEFGFESCKYSLIEYIRR